MEEIIRIISALLPFGPMSALAVGVVDFKKNKFEIIEADHTGEDLKIRNSSHIYFDLASLTKPLTNSLSYFLRPELFSREMLLCLNHRAGLPSWGLLSSKNWKEQILGYVIKESETLYSDFSALRVMLELEKKEVDQHKMCEEIWDKETLFWTNLSEDSFCVQNGFKDSGPNFRFAHDPNARVIQDFCSHAGLFSTIRGVCQTLLNYQERTDFIPKVHHDLARHSYRFSYGWDRVQNFEDPLAGKGCGKFTFGHLGFTGTSLWIDPEKLKAQVILSNATRFHWFDKSNLNHIRRAVGELVWKNA